MQIKISARHGHLGEAVQQHIRSKAEKLTHLFERLTMIEVTVDLGADHAKTVEFVVQAEHKHDFVARETHADVLAATDLALHKLEMQLRRYKERVQGHRGTPAAYVCRGPVCSLPLADPGALEAELAR